LVNFLLFVRRRIIFRKLPDGQVGHAVANRVSAGRGSISAGRMMNTFYMNNYISHIQGVIRDQTLFDWRGTAAE
jgi:hypothetical protein